MGFDDHFRKDYVSGEEFLERFGAERDHTFTIKEFGWRESYDMDTKRHVPKPVMYLRELDRGTRPLFLNQTSHKVLKALFGPGYEDREETIGQKITLRGKVKKAGRDTMHIVEVQPKRHRDMRAPLGENVARRFFKAIEGRGTRDGLVRFVMGRDPRLWSQIEKLESIADWPGSALELMGEYEKSLPPRPRQGAAAAAPPSQETRA